MTNPIEMAMYDISQFFLYPCCWPLPRCSSTPSTRWARLPGRHGNGTQGKPAGFELHALRRADPAATWWRWRPWPSNACKLPRIATRVAPMLGLVATMIPMGPALKALADGALQDVSRSLMIAFSAVILALLAAAISFTVVNVRKRSVCRRSGRHRGRAGPPSRPQAPPATRHAPEKAGGRRMSAAHPAPAAPIAHSASAQSTRRRLLEDSDEDDPHPLGREPDRRVPGHHRRLAAGRGAKPDQPVHRRAGHGYQKPGQREHGSHHQGRCQDRALQGQRRNRRRPGAEAGVAYKMKDGSMVYVPEAGLAQE